QQHLGPAPLEADDPRCAQLPAVQTDVVRTHARRQAALVEKLRVPLVDFQPQLAGLRVPIQIEKAGELPRTSGFVGNGVVFGRAAPGASQNYTYQGERSRCRV